MARSIKGRLFTRGKARNYYLQYYINGKEVKRALRDDSGQPITSKTKAQKAADKILAPYLAKDEVQRREQARAALLTAEEKAEELEQKQNAIALDKAFELAMKKPRRKIPNPRALRAKRNNWLDFFLFMSDNYPAIKTLDQVKLSHAEEYTTHLIEKGKYNKQVVFTRKNKTSTYKPALKTLSPRSINGYLVSINEIFSLLANDTGILVSPFANIPKQKLVQEKREAFTMAELQQISQNADDFIKAIFTLGLCTGLREADICLLKWKEVKLNENIIVKITRKTGKEVTIPIMPPLKAFLETQKGKSNDSEYVLPEHAEMYIKNSSGITWRVKKFLDGLGIETSRIPKGRTRAVSVKDVHSLRHSFCYYAGLYNVPLAIVQSVVGHMSPEMTKHYTMHATTADIKKAFANIPDIFGSINQTETKALTAEESKRAELMKFVETADIELIKKALQIFKDNI